MRVAPIEPQPFRHLDDDPQVLLRFAGRFERLTSELHEAIGVRERARLLGKCRSGQYDIGEIRRLGEEDVLHDQHLEIGQRLSCMLGVRIGHRGVLAHDVHAADRARVHSVHDLDHRQAGRRIESALPQRFEFLARRGLVHAPVVGIHHRDEAAVGGALHVVLPAQRMESRAGTADLAGQHAHRDEASRVVGAVNVL